MSFADGAYSESSGASAVDGDQSDNSVPRSGAVYVFMRDDIFWSQEAYVKSSNPESEDFFGLALTLDGDGDTLAVGAFRRGRRAWEQQSYLKANNAQAGDQFGVEAHVLHVRIGRAIAYQQVVTSRREASHEHTRVETFQADHSAEDSHEARQV